MLTVEVVRWWQYLTNCSTGPTRSIPDAKQTRCIPVYKGSHSTIADTLWMAFSYSIWTKFRQRGLSVIWSRCLVWTFPWVGYDSVNNLCLITIFGFWACDVSSFIRMFGTQAVHTSRTMRASGSHVEFFEFTSVWSHLIDGNVDSSSTTVDNHVLRTWNIKYSLSVIHSQSRSQSLTKWGLCNVCIPGYDWNEV